MKKILLILLLSLVPYTATAYTELVPRFMEQSILVLLDSFELFTKTKDVNTKEEKRCVTDLYIKALKTTNQVLNVNKTDGRSIPKESRTHDSLEETAIIMAIKGKDRVTEYYFDARHCVEIDSPALTHKKPPISRISVMDEQ